MPLLLSYLLKYTAFLKIIFISYNFYKTFDSFYGNLYNFLSVELF